MRPIALLLASVLPFQAIGATPEIVREPGKPQAVGAVHTVRAIPEACTRLEGLFTGEPAQPYRLTVVRTSPQCRPRARFVDFAKARPAEAQGWKLNDEIRVPSGVCESQQAVVRVWRKPMAVTPPKLDAQGRSRIYLQDASAQAKTQQLPQVPLYAAELELVGRACN